MATLLQFSNLDPNLCHVFTGKTKLYNLGRKGNIAHELPFDLVIASTFMLKTGASIRFSRLCLVVLYVKCNGFVVHCRAF